MTLAAHQSNAPLRHLREPTHLLDGNLFFAPVIKDMPAYP